jgi:hypothetical protein
MNRIRQAPPEVFDDYWFHVWRMMTMADEYEDQFVNYSRITIVEMRPYVIGEDMTNVYVDAALAEHGHPKEGDMIARNPRDRGEQWLMTKENFSANFETMAEARGAPQGVAGKPARASVKKEF